MTMFYIKTDLSVAGPFTGIEIREATLAGIVRPGSLLSHCDNGSWVAAAHAGLFSEKGTALPHPAGTPVPTFQTRGMPGAFMGPFKLRELIGFACQGMMPPGTELQSDPSRPWIRISGTGILPACLRGELVRIDAAGKLVLRTVIPHDLDERREQLRTLLSPIDRAKQIRATGATAAPLTSDAGREKGTIEHPETDSPNADAGDTSSPSHAVGPPPRPQVTRNEAFGVGGSPQPASKDNNTNRRRNRGPGVVTRLRSGFHQRIGRHVRPQIAAAVLLLVGCVIGLPVGYTAYKNRPLPQQNIVGNWVDETSDESETSLPRFGIRFTETGQCVLMNRTGSSWSGDFEWTQRDDQRSGFHPDGKVTIEYETPASGHEEDVVMPSDGHLRLGGFVKDPPQLDGQPVRDLFVRREGGRLSVGYVTSARWVDGERQLRAAWVHTRAAMPTAVSVADTLRDVPEESPDEGVLNSHILPIRSAVDAAATGREFDHHGKRTFRHGCLTFSKQVDTGFLLDRFGVADEARVLHDFEKPHCVHGPPMDDVVLLQYGEIGFVVDPAGHVVYLSHDQTGR